MNISFPIFLVFYFFYTKYIEVTRLKVLQLKIKTTVRTLSTSVPAGLTVSREGQSVSERAFTDAGGLHKPRPFPLPIPSVPRSRRAFRWALLLCCTAA